MPPNEGDTRPTLLDLETLEADPAPTFVIKSGSSGVGVLEFDFLFCNEAFRKSGLRDVVLAQDDPTLLFRSWTYALGNYKQEFEFAERIWSAKTTGHSGTWKIIKVVKDVSKEQHQGNGNRPETSASIDAGLRAGEQSSVYRRSKDDVMKKIQHSRTNELGNMFIPPENFTARWESIQTMMEMSDVGVFEYSPEGKLIHANEAWYRLSSHPRDLPAHVEFSFMQLVYPEDQTLVLTMWNELVSGNPVTFEMRWSSSADTVTSAQWVLSSCVPVLDDQGNVVSIAGNTIDINAQKKSQEVIQARVEALEQVRLSELKFERFAQLSPTAIYIFVPKTGMTFCNDQFLELTGLSRGEPGQADWLKVIAEEDVQAVNAYWAAIVEGKKSDSMQFRLRTTWINQDGARSNIWVESSSHQELDESGNVISIMGTLFDISQFKWAESFQQQRIQEALEAKRQQENFIDMTSHELRNPLSAVVQCADSVINTLKSTTLFDNDTSGIREDLTESLQTIVQCSIHQKRVIDDVLTLSKLDSELTVISPTRVHPVAVVSDAMKLFDAECGHAKIKLEFKEDETLREFRTAMLDPSRLLQIFFNLLTNAIKFTKDRPTRKITVTIGGSWTRPPKCWQNISFTNHDTPETDILDGPEWGTGRKAYLWIQVTDTGCGMTLDEQTKLFSRFSQATPRTHVKYGGSGLGLFISKSLAALQGGAIGVHSESNVGSNFAFFIGTRIVDPPAGLETRARPELSRIVSTDDAMRAVKLNVLIVEDNLVNQKVLRKQLLRFGWDVSVAGNGQEAVDWLKESVYWQENNSQQEDADTISTEAQEDPSPYSATKHPLDIILMDIEMPIMDGLTCTRLIREYEQLGLLAPPRPMHSSTTDGTRKVPRLPILAVSANARPEQVEQAIAGGMDDAISKPFRIPELWPKIRGLVERLAEQQ
ncbi:hypothetical protein P153DRAFT_300481 [Dothidotthia symphoricarpi CBS 119687]|uniref:Histidine kinase HHK8p n=1 Tax=Dothidotthia symphoricarpi CBS 119687 TaxID=1392245 RepID=A0A6A6A3R1_9PLEO|nr:uncharacterized protein P153DRAFT_300481 [Dothidotthia symphoricarpi CBS 119687]KAF2125221.1 hypothetical protein P153DRAFT_300481 [Dothidotthia symphoricarpi CBS 119687]